jgi:hypothetical protein
MSQVDNLITQTVSDAKALMHNVRKELGFPVDDLTPFNPRRLPAIPLVVDYIPYQDCIVCVGMYRPCDTGYSYLFHKGTNRQVFP